MNYKIYLTVETGTVVIVLTISHFIRQKKKIKEDKILTQR